MEGAGSERLRGPDRDTGSTGVSRRIETGRPVGVTGETKLRGKNQRKKPAETLTKKLSG
jgi:hypothetical protein